MIAVKTFDSTGIAPNGRVYAADLNAIQAAAAGLTDLTQAISVGSLVVGEAGLTLSRFGAGEMQIAGMFRSTSILKGLGGLYIGQFTTTQRNAIATNFAPFGIIIFNTTTNQFEWNSGTDAARVWKPLGVDPAGDIIFTGATSTIEFQNQGSGNELIRAARSGDTQPRFDLTESGLIQWGPGGATPMDTSMQRSAAGVLSLGSGVLLDFAFYGGTGGIKFADGSLLKRAPGYGTSFPGSPIDGQEYTLVDSITVPTYQWRFRYNGSSTQTDKWEFMGGTPALVEVATAESLPDSAAALSYAALATAGPSFTIPRAGVYEISVGALIEMITDNGTPPQVFMSYDIGGTGAVDADAVIGANHTTGATGTLLRGSHQFRAQRKTIAAASTALVAKYRMSNHLNGNTPMPRFSNRVIRVLPIRCS